ncbi:MAG: hypothetical protein ABJA80_07775 [bacterium]
MPVLALLCCFTAACAGGSAPATLAPQLAAAPTPTARASDLITEEELEDPSVITGDALEAVQRLRPAFLITRGKTSFRQEAPGVSLSVDGAVPISVDNLRQLRPNQILEIRYLGAIEATQRFGTITGSGGVILVRMK